MPDISASYGSMFALDSLLMLAVSLWDNGTKDLSASDPRTDKPHKGLARMYDNATVSQCLMRGHSFSLLHKSVNKRFSYLK